MKNIKTPEDWIEKAIKIPQTNKKPTPFYLKPYAIASVACLLICCTVVFLIINSFSSSNVIPITDFTTSQNATQAESSNTTSPSNSSSQLEPTEKSESSTTTSNIIQNPTIIPDSTIFSSTISNSSIANSTNSTHSSTGEKPSAIATTSKDDETVQPPTVKPDYSEDEIEYINPGQYAPIPPPTETPTLPIHTTSVVVEPTTHGSDKMYFNGTISFIIKENSVFSSSKYIYCHLSTESHRDKTYEYSSEELCSKNGNTFKFSMKNTFFRYDYNKTEYTIAFYDNMGNKCSKTIRFGDKNKVIFEL